MTRVLCGRESPGDGEWYPQLWSIPDFDGQWIAMTWAGWVLAVNLWARHERTER